MFVKYRPYYKASWKFNLILFPHAMLAISAAPAVVQWMAARHICVLCRNG